MALGQQQPVVTGVLHQPTARLHQSPPSEVTRRTDRAKAYTDFFEYCRDRLISLGAKTIGDLSLEEQKIIAEKQSALVEKYGATKYRPFYVQ